MTLQQIQYFRVLAKVQHYTKASEELLISQPSLSYSISQLEKELDVSLFEKQGKKVILNKNGEFFLKYVEKSLDILDEGIKMLQILIDTSKGNVNLGYIYSISSVFIPKLINNFYNDDSNKSIKFNFVQNLNDNLITDLKNNKIDLAFCTYPSEGINYIPIFYQPLYVIVPNDHRLASKKEIDISEIKDEPFIFLNKNSGLRQMLDTIFKEMDIKPNIIFEAEECNAVMAFVSLNYGISIIPEVPAMNSNIATVNIKNSMLKRKIYMCWGDETHLTPPVRKVKNYILQNYKLNN
jgi:DNA-binding transcriptional LysR family regulator